MNDILEQPEGWYLDPYGRHEQRWFSAGKPTALVRDHGTDGHDVPPGGPPPGPPLPVPEFAGRGSRVPSTEDPRHEVFSAAFGNIAVQP
jgi:hypothetical protein